MRRVILIALLLVTTAWAEAPTRAAQELTRRLEAMDVVHHWQPRAVHVNWETGEPEPGRPFASHGHTHCSAFVAAACARLGVYILRPPDHPPIYLASAQQEWLNSPEGRDQGWRRLEGALEARDQANRGQLVVVSWKNPQPDKPGHIAIVRPSLWGDSRIAAEGPEIMQAGGTNFLSTSAKRGFRSHHRAFENGELQYHAHALSL